MIFGHLTLHFNYSNTNALFQTSLVISCVAGILSIPSDTTSVHNTHLKGYGVPGPPYNSPWPHTRDSVVLHQENLLNCSLHCYVRRSEERSSGQLRNCVEWQRLSRQHFTWFFHKNATVAAGHKTKSALLLRVTETIQSARAFFHTATLITNSVYLEDGEQLGI